MRSKVLGVLIPLSVAGFVCLAQSSSPVFGPSFGGSPSGAVSSVFTRTGAVVAAIGDYTAAQVTNALDLSNVATQTMQGNLLMASGKSINTGILRDTAGTAVATLSSGQLLGSGTVDGKAPITVTTTTPVTLGGTFKSGYTYNASATAATAVTYNLPSVAAGLQYCVGNSWNGSAATTGVLTVVAASGQTIIFTDGTLSAAAGNVTSGGAASDAACFVGVDGGHWQLTVQRGTWTKH